MPRAGWVKPQALVSTKRNSCYRRQKRQEDRVKKTLEYQKQAICDKYRIRFHRYQKRNGYDPDEEVRNLAERDCELRMLEESHSRKLSDTPSVTEVDVETASIDQPSSNEVSSVGAVKRQKRPQDRLGRFVSAKKLVEGKDPDFEDRQDQKTSIGSQNMHTTSLFLGLPTPTPVRPLPSEGRMVPMIPQKPDTNLFGWGAMPTMGPNIEVFQSPPVGPPNPPNPSVPNPNEPLQPWLQDYIDNFTGDSVPDWNFNPGPATQNSDGIVYWNHDGAANVVPTEGKPEAYYDDELPPMDLDDIRFRDILLQAIAALDGRDNYVNQTDADGNLVSYSVEDLSIGHDVHICRTEEEK
ncbi:hypothetical protein EX30DRAFT_338203 [Ascodesmis nigricans]|uniref:Uncharacterized protein n=1 Tax=Ascodesmis nigricans TaxID=341454 RepID=A0A4S2N399_9PEZI|nr:hypothetical protein EX30DRAFT_338203 [Ascodesmis nigricans]